MDTIRSGMRDIFVCLGLGALAACGGGSEQDQNADGRVSTQATAEEDTPVSPTYPGSVQFGSQTFQVDESGGNAMITLTRTLGSAGTVSVRVRSSDTGTVSGAAQVQDYTSVDTVVTFAGGDTSPKTMTVPILDDGTDEGDETVSLTLSSPTAGVTLGAVFKTVLTIRDDDVSVPVAPRAAMSAALGKLHFDWTAAQGATSYRVMADPDGRSGFTQVGAEIPAGQLSADVEIAVHRIDWSNARYLITACNEAGCSNSNVLAASSVSYQLAIGYFKASSVEGGDYFGEAVAVSSDGNTLVVGAPYDDDSGSVHIFTRSNGIWTQQGLVRASNAEAYDYFGESVALSSDGNTLVVGASSEDSPSTGINGNQNDDCETSEPFSCAYSAGAVYVFARSGGKWTQQSYIKASNAESYEYFGSSVALSSDGNTVVVGAPYEDGGDDALISSGAVYAFTRTAGVWTQQSYLKASDPEAYGYFGSSIALSSDGNTLMAGAPQEDDSGTVQVFARSNGAWMQQSYLKASNAEASDDFGTSVALSSDGTTVVVGAPYEDDSGAVYVFTRADSGWTQQSYLKASNAEANDYFGGSVALSGDGNTLVVSAPYEDGSSTGIDGNQGDDCEADAPASCAYNAGAVYLY